VVEEALRDAGSPYKVLRLSKERKTSQMRLITAVLAARSGSKAGFARFMPLDFAGPPGQCARRQARLAWGEGR
jgi:hypothetical protein